MRAALDDGHGRRATDDLSANGTRCSVPLIDISLADFGGRRADLVHHEELRLRWTCSGFQREVVRHGRPQYASRRAGTPDVKDWLGLPRGMRPGSLSGLGPQASCRGVHDARQSIQLCDASGHLDDVGCGEEAAGKGDHQGGSGGAPAPAGIHRRAGRDHRLVAGRRDTRTFTAQSAGTLVMHWYVAARSSRVAGRTRRISLLATRATAGKAGKTPVTLRLRLASRRRLTAKRRVYRHAHGVIQARRSDRRIATRRVTVSGRPSR